MDQQIDTKPPSAFTRVRRLGERGAYDRTTVYSILDAPFCHVGHIIAGRPTVIPTVHWREGDTLYWHGSNASRMLRNTPGEEVGPHDNPEDLSWPVWAGLLPVAMARGAPIPEPGLVESLRQPESW